MSVKAVKPTTPLSDLRDRIQPECQTAREQVLPLFLQRVELPRMCVANEPLEWAGIFERRDATGERGVEYHLTEAGQALRPVIELMGTWGQRFVRSHVRRDDLDPGILMWDMRRRLNVPALPADRAVIHFEFSQVPGSKRYWWVVVSRGDVDLCLKDPGYDVDLYVTTGIRTMTQVWMGEVDVRSAVRSGAQRDGSAPLRRSINRWLGLSVFAPGARKG